MPKIAEIRKIVKKNNPLGISLFFSQKFGKGFGRDFANFYKRCIEPIDTKSQNPDLPLDQQLELINILIIATRFENRRSTTTTLEELYRIFEIDLGHLEIVLSSLTPALLDIFLKKKFEICTYNILVLHKITLAGEDNFFQQDQNTLNKFMVVISKLEKLYYLNTRTFNFLRTSENAERVMDIVASHKHLNQKLQYLFDPKYSHLLPTLQMYDSPHLVIIINELEIIGKLTRENIVIALMASELATATVPITVIGDYWNEIIAHENHLDILQCLTHLNDIVMLCSAWIEPIIRHDNPAELRNALLVTRFITDVSDIDIDNLFELAQPMSYASAIRELQTHNNLSPITREMILTCEDRVGMAMFLIKFKLEVKIIHKYFDAFKDYKYREKLLGAVTYLMDANIEPTNKILKLLIKGDDPLTLAKAMRCLQNRALLNKYLHEVSSSDKLLEKANALICSSTTDKVFLNTIFASSQTQRKIDKAEIDTTLNRNNP